MKVKSIEVSNKVTNGNKFGGEDRKAREARMKAFWANKAHSTFFRAGRLLAGEVDGKRFADLLLAGEVLEFDTLTVNGVKLECPGTKLSLATIKQWGCPACSSAHGTGVGASPKQDADLLAANQFYYNPATKQVFTISSTCWSGYVKALGAADRFTTATAEPSKVK